MFDFVTSGCVLESSEGLLKAGESAFGGVVDHEGGEVANGESELGEETEFGSGG